MNGDSTNIYVGAPIDQESERKFLAAMVAWLEEQKVQSVVLANVEINGRQIDCIVATANVVSVIEVKSSQLPIRGDINGNWTRLSASGEWKNYTNAFQQAVGAKNRLRDAMQASKPVGAFHPDGYVVFTSPIPDGSELTAGNFKVRVTTIDNFLSQIKTAGTSPWSFADWQAFVRKLALTATTLSQVVASAEARETFDLLKKYNDAVVSEYGREGGRWLPEREERRDELLTAAAAKAGCFVSGPSGCGKTLMAKWLTVELAKAGYPTFFLAAKDFAGSWADSLRREIGLLADGNPAALYRAVVRADRPVFLVLDGVNEFGAAASEAQRGVRALARRLNARLIVTAQDAKSAEFSGLRTVEVARPSLELKKSIARSAGGALAPTALEVLRAVESGIEAGIVGQIGSGLRADVTRLLLVDQYIRKRLGKHARAGSFGLRRLASMLHEQVAFSIAEESFDEFMRSQHLSFSDCDALFSVGLLVKRAGRVSFSHEMIQNACVAFDLARMAAVDATAFGQRLSTPVLEPIAGDIIAAIEDGSVCRGVLREVISSSLLAGAASGKFGPVAASTALEMLTEVVDTCIDEIRNARLALSKEGDAVRIGWEDGTRRQWSFPEEARLQAIGRRAAMGPGIDVFLNLCAEMDARLLSERQRWADFARQERYPIRSQSFALTYCGFGESIGFTTVARSTQRGFGPLSQEVKSYQFNPKNMTSGQLHFFLEGRHVFFESEDSRFAEDLIYLLRERFRREPYHVQLAILNSVGYARGAPDATLERLVEAINSLEVNPGNWGINMSIIDALKILGAVEDEGGEARAQVRAELESVLGDDESTVDNNLAFSICVSMFDHPFDSIYGEEIDELDDEMRRRLYRRALGATDIESSMSLAWLAKEVASFGVQEDARLLQPLTGLPSRANPFPQEEWGAFVVATRFVGRHHAELAPIDATTAAERCLGDIRTLIYAAEARRDADKTAARLAWQRLHETQVQLVIGCLSEVHAALFIRSYQTDSVAAYPPLDLISAYSADCLNVSRRFIDEGNDAQFFHQVPHREDGTSFAFDTIGAHGDRSDVDRVRARSRGHRFARYALAALKRLDAGPTEDRERVGSL